MTTTPMSPPELLSDEEVEVIITKAIGANGGEATRDELMRVLDWALDTRTRALMLEATLTADIGLVFPDTDGEIVAKSLPRPLVAEIRGSDAATAARADELLAQSARDDRGGGLRRYRVRRRDDDWGQR